MGPWKNALRQALVSGTTAGLLSAVVLAVAGRLENRSAAGPLNGPSQWLYGRRAAYRRAASLKHTLTGVVIHHAMAIGWAILHERLFGQRRRHKTAPQCLRDAAITAAAANFVDYQLTPQRLQPGFDVQLSRKSLFAVYAAFALGLAMYDLATRKRRTKPRVD